MNNVVIIGAGQLGSRHLQALALVSPEISIQVVDSSAEALSVAESRFKEVGSGFKGQISFHTSIAELPEEISVAIVATGSKVRRAVLEQLLDHSNVMYCILEKVLFTKEEDYVAVEKLLKQKNVKAWVNCPRRMMKVYQDIQKELKGNIHFVATGNNWGMGCNGIHLLDIFSFLTGRTDIKLSNELIDKTILESKRPGYIEFSGAITGTANQHSFHITSFSEAVSPLHVHIHTGTTRYSLQEGANGKLWISRLDKNWEWEEKGFEMPFQSKLTNIVVQDLLSKGNCDLTPFETSKELHLLFLNNLIDMMRKINNDNTIKECPIT